MLYSRPYSLTWLPFLKQPVPSALQTPSEVAAFELESGTRALSVYSSVTLELLAAMNEAYEIEAVGNAYHIRGGNSGLLYGVYRFLTLLAAQEEPPHGIQRPFFALRMLNCWDNPDGSVERGYAGRSLFFDGGQLHYDGARLRQLGRMLASIGLNTLCVNNVNVAPPADQLIAEEWLGEVARLAAIFRPFGVRLLLSIDYAAPLRHGLDSADPLSPAVKAWWERCTANVYRAVPDLAGFLVKADSEHRPGPFAYGRSHAQGANMLARALKPHGGALIWRCFVYNCLQDWRDHTVDRPMAAYAHYAHLDGQFDDNVILQIKHGPFDFQVREPLSPLLFCMPQTRKAMEVQLSQEYTGQQIDLYAMPGMWRELFDELPPSRLSAIAAVGNLGTDQNWTGHDFAQLNLYAFGCMAWNPLFEEQSLLRQWCRLTYALDSENEERLCGVLSMSREVYERYTAPLGLCWMVNPHHHYGPSPEGYEYSPWGTFHRADREGVGIDRTSAGTGYVLQYPKSLQERYDTPQTCPDKLLLFFHRLPYTYLMRDGRTLIQRIYDDHFAGVLQAELISDELRRLPLPEEVRLNVLSRMERQLQNACEWRDVINTFFHRLSGVEDQECRVIYP